MIEKIRQKLLAFIESDKDVPLLAGFSVGIYMLLFYYSRNFALANSWNQLLFFTAYYMAMPMAVFFVAYKAAKWLKLANYKKNVLFVGIIAFTGFFLIQFNSIGVSKKLVFGVVLIIALLLSFKVKKYYKLLILMLFLMSLFNIAPLLYIAQTAVTASSEWKKQPDAIEGVTFGSKPNIYYIQPDGYTSFSNLADNKYYNFDDSSYTAFLKQQGFTIYNDYRSNYPSTLLSNSATFSMKHHYVEKNVDEYAARGIIMNDNPVLRILKNNGYATNFITENPYLLMNRPQVGYDYTNIKLDEIPYLKDGFGTEKNVATDLKSQIDKNKKSGNFYFVEKFTPGHINVFKAYSKGKDAEKALYIAHIKKANSWLKDVIAYIEAKDPSAIVIIGADHGGFAGFDYTHQSYEKTSDQDLIRSIFGAHLAIKWNDAASSEYDKELKTGVNLFRTVFSYLAKDKKYLTHMQENSSYMPLTSPQGLYRYISGDDKVVFEKK